MMIKLHW